MIVKQKINITEESKEITVREQIIVIENLIWLLEEEEDDRDIEAHFVTLNHPEMLFVKKICKEKIKNYIGSIIGNYYKKEQKLYIVRCDRLDENNSYSILRIKNEKEPIIIYEELREETLKVLKKILGNLELESERENKRKEKNK